MLFSETNGLLVGSGRSVQSVDLFALLTRHKELLLRFGGHRLAAGATINTGAFETLKKALSDDLAGLFPTGLPEETCVFEDRLALSEITPDFARELGWLSPFGEGNRAPLFMIEGALSNVRTMGRDGSHLGAKLSDETASVRIVSFGNGERCADWGAIRCARAYASIELGSYQGRPEVSVRTEALEYPTANAVADAVSACVRTITHGLPLPDAETLDRLPRVTEPEIRSVYRALLPRLQNGAGIECLSEKERTALLPLLEIGVVRYANGKFLTESVREKKQIQNAPLYPVLCLE